MHTQFDHVARELSGVVEGEVLFDATSRALYSADASNYRKVPAGVVLPRNDSDIAAVLSVCGDHDVPVTMRGGGTSIAGNSIGPGVVLDTSRYMNAVLDIDRRARTTTVQPGVVAGHLADALAPHGLIFAPDPSTVRRATIGGMIGNNACGSHSVAWGKTSENVRELDVLLADGTRLTVGPTTPQELSAVCARPGRVAEIHRELGRLAAANLAPLRTELGRFGRQVSGYGLHELLPEHGRNLARALVGSEGTCAVVLSATLQLIEPPAQRVLLVVGFPDDVAAAAAVPQILTHAPLTVEGMGRALIAGLHPHGDTAAAIGRLPDGAAWLFIETGGGSVAEAVDRARRIAADLPGAPCEVFTDPRARRALWTLRADGSGLATRGPGGVPAYPGWEDSAVPPDRLAGYLAGLRELLGQYGFDGVPYGHFGEGCVHIRIDAPLTSQPGTSRYRAFLEDATDLVVAYGGCPSGEHGDGRARSALLERVYSPRLIELFGRFKAIWDPANMLNPGIMVDPVPVEADVRWLDLPDPTAPTEFDYPGETFAGAVSRCVGVGKCRVEHGTAMCPSYQVTRDELHSTRGRARMLFEMLRGEVIEDGWRSTEVLGALDLCLSCKACKSDCPVDVDMATYKSEFLAHHYRGRLRPRSHYALGWLPLWLRVAGVAPGMVNALAARELPARIAKRAAGVDARRDLPVLASRAGRAPLRTRESSGPTPRGDVLLWPDTFTTYLDPDIAVDAAAVLRAAGYRVLRPRGRVCCGLTAITTGQLGLAKRVARHSLRVLAPHLAAGTPIVGLEPSCTEALRHDLPRLLPGDDRTRCLADTTFTFAELLADHTPGWEPPRVDAAAVVQTHCHQLSESGDDADQRLERLARIDRVEIAPGCCGLAGNFGFEQGHYEVSIAVGEQNLLPAVRALPDDALVIADGFSCRTQVAGGTDRRARHLAQVLAERL
ncbi:FAD-binding and (Fe-S)-binding domain-containing protein [Speluncibacter jeojiensis]|uniref:FAD-binding oxidoreductase n=1 Tax=Speluncibacter jeojiensis TaxID=2710754 RepID=A0A9X4RFP7_9ACTN|nr:FAD-binding oxidoreductase [Corynebacteriales bacterium D3-21]